MSIFDRLLGKAGKIDNSKIEASIKELLVPNEFLEISFKLVRDMVVFTNKRLIIIDAQGSGVKKTIQFIPYRSISRYQITTAGLVDTDTELELFIADAVNPVVKLDLGPQKQNLALISQTLAKALF